MGFKTGDRIRITDNATGKTVLQGTIVQVKPCNSTNVFDTVADNYILIHRQYVSCDFKNFFDTESRRYSVSICNDSTDIFNIPSSYIIDTWKPACRKNTGIQVFDKIDIFVEHDIMELDNEIKEFVCALNELGFITTSSCCGHGGAYPHVIVCMNTNSSSQLPRLQFVVNYLNSSFGDLVSVIESCMEIDDFNKENTSGQFLVKVVVGYKEEDYKDVLDSMADRMRDLKNVI